MFPLSMPLCCALLALPQIFTFSPAPTLRETSFCCQIFRYNILDQGEEAGERQEWQGLSLDSLVMCLRQRPQLA